MRRLSVRADCGRQPLSRQLLHRLALTARPAVPPQEAHAACAEFWPQDPENQGRDPEALAADSRLLALPAFRCVRLQGVPADWWAGSADLGRLQVFLDFLRSLPHRRIAVVTHYGFVRNLLLFAGHPQPVALRNCGWIRTHWRCEPVDPAPDGEVST